MFSIDDRLSCKQNTQQQAGLTDGVDVLDLGIDVPAVKIAETARAEKSRSLHRPACKTCTYPRPCRFPEQAVSSMEAYGLLVIQVCRDAGVAYHHGERTVTYTACILLK